MNDNNHIYVIFGRYQGGEREELDTAEDLGTAIYLQNEYRIAFDCNWKIFYRRMTLAQYDKLQQE